MESNKFYIGHTSDLDRRLKEHNFKQSRWTKKFGKWKLIYYEDYTTRGDAIKRERELKRFKNVKKFLENEG